MADVVSRRYIAIKRSYGFLNRSWEPGEITQETTETPHQNKLSGIMFVAYADGLTLDDAKISVGKMARPAPEVSGANM